MAKRADAYPNEAKVLEQAQSFLDNKAAHTTESLTEAYTNMVEEYGKMLNEVRFITKVSDKLESKLNAANEKLEAYNAQLTDEADHAKKDREKAIERSKRIYQDKSQIEKMANKQQMTIVIFVAVYIITVVMLVYLFVFSDYAFVKEWMK